MRAICTNLAIALMSAVLLMASTVQAQPNEPELKLLSANAEAPARQAEAQALKVMYAFMRSFNAKDPKAFADTLLFPHVRIASGGVRVSPDAQTFIQATDFDAFAQRFDWAFSRWESIETVQADENKVHFAVVFVRHNRAGEPNATFRSLYILQRAASGWGIRSRSSFAP
jgi:hypothetical protein